MKTDKLFTIIYYINGGEYIFQTKAEDHNKAAIKFIKSNDFSEFVSKERKKHLDELKEFELPLTKIKQRKNVWFFSLRIKQKQTSFNVIQTNPNNK